MDTPSGGVKEPLSKSGILDVLSDETTDAPVVDKELNLDITEPESEDTETPDEELEKSKGKDDETEEEIDELKELEDELKEPKVEDLELTTPVKKREILAKYPNVFKDFPSLEKAYYRELAFTRIFPTVEDAKEGANAINVLNNFEKELMTGKTETLLRSVLEQDKNAFAKIADTYMETLAQVDERAYHHVLGNITKDIVKAMVNSGKTSNNQDLQDSATILYEFMFGNKEWKPKSNLAIEESNDSNSERSKLEKEREEFETSKFTTTRNELMGGVDNRIKSVIDSNIDKKLQMTPFIKKNATREVKTKLDELLKSDTRFQTIVNQLWKKAKENKYSREYLDKIESAHVSKAKVLLPTIIVSVKKEALRGNSVSRNRAKDTDNEPNESKNEPNSTRSRNRGGPNNDDYRNKPKPGESSLDFLNR